MHLFIFSQDVEALSNKNNLTFTELLQPFSKLTSDVTLKDVDGTNHNVPSLHLILQDFKKDPQKLVNQKLMLDRMSEENCDDQQMVTRSVLSPQCLHHHTCYHYFHQDIWQDLCRRSRFHSLVRCLDEVVPAVSTDCGARVLKTSSRWENNLLPTLKPINHAPKYKF